jgi:hypothetical protein
MSSTDRRQPAARRRLATGAGLALVVSSAIVVVPAFPAAAKTTSLAAHCPKGWVVATYLKQRVNKVAASTTTGSTGTKRTCTYHFGRVPVPDTIIIGAPVTKAQFLASEPTAGSGVSFATVSGLGTAAWVIVPGNGLSMLRGTTDIVIEAPSTTDAELEALARKIPA